MKIVCAWCKKIIKEAEKGKENDLVSHGICEECKNKMLNELK